MTWFIQWTVHGRAWLGRAMSGAARFGPAWLGMEHNSSQEALPLEVTLKLTGSAPLIMHAPTLADPMHPSTKALKKITSKTSRAIVDEDHIAKYRIQFEANIYHDPATGPYLPGMNVAKCILQAARKSRSGKKVEEGLILVSPINALVYDGPRDISGLWNDLRFRKTMPVNGNPNSAKKSMVMSCRPIFPEWSCTATLLINPSVLSVEDAEAFAVTAGQMVGLGDWRPWHGRFTSQVVR